MKQIFISPQAFPLTCLKRNSIFLFKHPRSKKQSQFTVSPSGKLYQIDCEFSIDSQEGKRCAFWGEEIILDAEIHFAVAWNPILFCIGILREWSLVKGAKMSPLSEILMEFSLPLEHLGVFQRGIGKIAQLREIDQDVYCRLDEGKVESFLSQIISSILVKFDCKEKPEDVSSSVNFIQKITQDYSTYCTMKRISNANEEKRKLFVAIQALGHFISQEDEARLMKAFGIELCEISAFSLLVSPSSSSTTLQKIKKGRQSNSKTSKNQTKSCGSGGKNLSKT